MPFIGTGNKYDILNTNVGLKFAEAYAAAKAKSIWSQMASEMPSSTTTEVYPFISQMPKLREWLGPRVVNNLKARDYSLKNKKYEDTVAISREDFDDDKFGLLTMGVQNLAVQAAMWPDDIIAKAVEDGITNLCFDGQPMFDDAHPYDVNNVGGGTYSNRYDATTSGACTLTPTNYAAVRAAMALYHGEDGRPWGLTADLLMVPPALESTAKSLLQAEFVAQAVGAAAAGVSNIWKGSAGILVNPFLTDTGRWYLLNTSFAIKPFLFQLRDAPAITPRVDPALPNTFDLDEYQWGVRCRGAAGYSLPFLAIACK